MNGCVPVVGEDPYIDLQVCRAGRWMCRRGRMDISYYTINQTGRARPRVCWKTAFFRVNAYLGKEFADGDSDDGADA